ncbi:hypothetical protein AMAG_18221 [Allomyces macrogynus ATCC 38327]|uniref:GATA-type domain-containing protein n=1 Tax=Allomyces macrogynus (strain ATCC 38327) TaxID=578462 RepID=A0A0L0SB25_ALLM3|nr:hypothetical protein AMAG_18221 [Allomyces macrogynus ATCC 38327]|eukprot:KNE59637.1 hypothetical protein AMAG_18221 [Allomyces macrogynus ATCC 38327]
MSLAESPWFEDDEVAEAAADAMVVDAQLDAVENVETGTAYLGLNLRRAREARRVDDAPSPPTTGADSDASVAAGPAPKKRRSAAAALGAAAAKRKTVILAAPPSPSLTASSTSGMSDRSTPMPMPLVPAHQTHHFHAHAETTTERTVPVSADYGARVARPTMYEQLTARGVPWCRFCGVTESPNWRQGPWGKKSLCNKHGCAWSGIAGNKRIRLDLRGYVEETLEDRVIPVVQDCTYCAVRLGVRRRSGN